jgi:hypothetical protein
MMCQSLEIVLGRVAKEAVEERTSLTSLGLNSQAIGQLASVLTKAGPERAQPVELHQLISRPTVGDVADMLCALWGSGSNDRHVSPPQPRGPRRRDVVLTLGGHVEGALPFLVVVTVQTLGMASSLLRPLVLCSNGTCQWNAAMAVSEAIGTV